MQQVKYVANARNFSKISSCPIAYWAANKIFTDFQKFDKIKERCEVRNDLTTGDNNSFLRLWYEVDLKDGKKWVPCNKGGAFRRWGGNRDYLIDWESDGYRLKHTFDENGKLRATLRGIDMNFLDGVTMSRVTSGLPSFRYMYNDSISESATNAIYPKDGNIVTSYYIMGMLNSVVGVYILDLVNPTLNIVPDDIRGIPLPSIKEEEVADIVLDNIQLAERDWDSFETSWDFKKHPLI